MLAVPLIDNPFTSFLGVASAVGLTKDTTDMQTPPQRSHRDTAAGAGGSANGAPFDPPTTALLARPVEAPVAVAVSS